MEDVTTFEELQQEIKRLTEERNELYYIAERQTQQLFNCYGQINRANAKNYTLIKRNRNLIKYNRLFAASAFIVLAIVIIRTLFIYC